MSLKSTTTAERRHHHQLDDLFREKLNASGRFKIVTIPPDMQTEIARRVEISMVAAHGLDPTNWLTA